MLRWLGFFALFLLIVGVVSSHASQFGGEAAAPSTFTVRPKISIPSLPPEENESDPPGVDVGVDEPDEPFLPDDPSAGDGESTESTSEDAGTVTEPLLDDSNATEPEKPEHTDMP